MRCFQSTAAVNLSEKKKMMTVTPELGKKVEVKYGKIQISVKHEPNEEPFSSLKYEGESITRVKCEGGAVIKKETQENLIVKSEPPDYPDGECSDLLSTNGCQGKVRIYCP